MLIRTTDCPALPWKNGGGVTRELLTWPPKAQGTDDSQLHDWQLRISVADITQDGAFSSFEGVSRAFAVIEGAGVQLQLGGEWQDVTPDSEPVQFDGADAPDCKLIQGATRDLNVMWRGDHQVTLRRAYAGQTNQCRGYFSLVNQSLTWMTANAIFPSRAGVDLKKHIGWWIDFL
jgi:uncharacterized protein